MRGLYFFSLFILTQVSSDVLCHIIGFIGRNVTLPCRYDTKYHGMLSFCWGLGMLPNFQCSNPILSSQDGVAWSAESSRYQLLGRLADGDISLTILNAQHSDAGVYGCRVEIAGWFNDLKLNTHLAMEEAPVEQPVTQGWTLATTGRPSEQPEIWTTTAPQITEVGEQLERSVKTEGKFTAFLEVGIIARIGAIFFCTIIAILVSIFRRQFQRKGALQQPDTPTAENIYEGIPHLE